MSGDVWLVDGIQDERATLRWQRFATGLNQPLGLVVVNDTIYVNGRDQITRLHDTNQDGFADHYENFNNAVMAGTNFHAFNLNLEVDAQGRFLWAKSTPWPTGNPGELSDAHQITPHDGVLFRLSPDGRELDIIARGLRNPNGLSIGPKGGDLRLGQRGQLGTHEQGHAHRRGGVPRIRAIGASGEPRRRLGTC